MKNFEKIEVGKHYLDSNSELFKIIKTIDFGGLKYIGENIFGRTNYYYEDGTHYYTSFSDPKKDLREVVENKTINIIKVVYGEHLLTLPEETMNMYTSMGFKLMSILREEGYRRYVYYFQMEYKIN